MTIHPAVRLTWDDLQTFPDDGKRRELFEGDLVVSPASRPRHQIIVAALYDLLRERLRTGPLPGHVLFAPVDVRFADDTVVEPDLLVLSPDQYRRLANAPAIDEPPLLVVQVLSPASAGRDRGARAKLYARYGVPHYWIVDPAAQTLEALAWDGAAWQPTGTSEGRLLKDPAPFDGLVVDLAAIFTTP